MFNFFASLLHQHNVTRRLHYSVAVLLSVCSCGLNLRCVCFEPRLLPLQAKVTTELSQVLDEEEKRWMETLHIEEYQITLAKTVIQVHTVTMVTAGVCLR